MATVALAASPAEDSFKQIIEEGNPAYLDWSTALGDRERIAKLYRDNDFHLLWSDGRKPTAAAIALLQEMRAAAERGLDPEDYPGNRLAYLLIDLIDAPHSGIEQWANPSSIAKHQMKIVRGSGDAVTVMPNTVDNVELVAKGSLRLRHFSHGCVRVSDPVGLAQYVLRDSPEWTREKILAAMNGTSPVTVTLKNRIRVFIVYGTALATEKGNILFFDDIYGHDQRLEEALNSRRPQHVAPIAAVNAPPKEPV
jgi:murein L,D-transpeptidase YcbB/YkuD